MEDNGNSSISLTVHEPQHRVVKIMSRKSLENLQVQHNKIMSLSSKQFSEFFNPVKEDSFDPMGGPHISQ